MKRFALALVAAVLSVCVMAPATAAPKHCVSLSAVDEPGTSYCVDQEVYDYVQRREALLNELVTYYRAFIDHQQQIMAERDAASADALNAKQARIVRLETRVERKDAKIDNLRALVRSLR
jgi:hypothetical protein